MRGDEIEAFGAWLMSLVTRIAIAFSVVLILLAMSGLDAIDAEQAAQHARVATQQQVASDE